MRNWFFYNSRSGSQTELDEDELGRHLREIPEDEMPFTFVWKGGWKHWVPVVKVPELISMRYMAPPPPPQMGTRYPPERLGEEIGGLDRNKKLEVVREDDDVMIERFRAKPVVTMTGTKPSPSNATMTKARQQERRASNRVDGRLKVMVKCGEQVFRTHTTNVSVKGLMLEHAVPPPMLDSEIELYIYSPDGQSCLRMQARLLEDQKEPRRLKLLEANDLTERRLHSWISTLGSDTQKIAVRKK